jgi:Caudovirus prohead serine protease
MRKPIDKLMDLHSSFEVELGDNSVAIKGFVSVEKVDRQGEVAPPLAFNIPTFLNSGTVLVNHKFWKDKNGNSVAVGKVRQMHPAYISAIENDEFVVNDLVSKGFITNFPVSKAPELGVGDKGLFAFIDVTESDIAEKVKKGEYNSFSWRGLVTKGLEFGPNNEPIYKFRHIDLWEVSLVNIPVMNQSTFVVSQKSVSDQTENLYITQVLLPKSDFEYQAVKGFLDSHGLSSDIVFDGKDYVFANQVENLDDYDLAKSVRVKLGGTDVLLSPTKRLTDVVVPKNKGGSKMKFYSLTEETLNTLFKDGFNTASKSVAVGDQTLEVVEVTGKVAEKSETENETPNFEQLISEKFAEFAAKVDILPLSQKVTDLEAQLKELTDKISATEASLASSKVASEGQEKVEADASAELEAVKGILAEVVSQSQKMNETIENVVKSVVSLGNVVPNKQVRTETAKSVETPAADDLLGFFKNVIRQ